MPVKKPDTSAPISASRSQDQWILLGLDAPVRETRLASLEAITPLVSARTEVFYNQMRLVARLDYIIE